MVYRVVDTAALNRNDRFRTSGNTCASFAGEVGSRFAGTSPKICPFGVEEIWSTYFYIYIYLYNTHTYLYIYIHDYIILHRYCSFPSCRLFVHPTSELQDCWIILVGKKCRVFDDIQLRMAQNHPPLGDWVCVLRSCESPAFWGSGVPSQASNSCLPRICSEMVPSFWGVMGGGSPYGGCPWCHGPQNGWLNTRNDPSEVPLGWFFA